MAEVDLPAPLLGRKDAGPRIRPDQLLCRRRRAPHLLHCGLLAHGVDAVSDLAKRYLENGQVLGTA